MHSEGQDAILSDVTEFFKAKNTIQQDLISQLYKLHIKTPSAKNDTSEHSFSALHRIKTSQHSTMTQARLNHIMVMNIH